VLAHTFLCRCFFSTIPFRIRTYVKRTRKPCRIRTSKTQHLKSFRIRTYKKPPGGWPLPLLRPLRARTPLRGATSNPSIQRFASVFFSGSTFDCRLQPSAVSIDLASHSLCITWRWTSTPITGTLLVTRRSLEEEIRHPQLPGVLFPRSNSFRFPHQSKKESEQTCSRNSWQVRRLQYWHVRQPHPFARKN
jgi:hypothetical protein